MLSPGVSGGQGTASFATRLQTRCGATISQMIAPVACCRITDDGVDDDAGVEH